MCTIVHKLGRFRSVSGLRPVHCHLVVRGGCKGRTQNAAPHPGEAAFRNNRVSQEDTPPLRRHPLAVQRKRAAELVDTSPETFDRWVRPHLSVVYLGSLRLYLVSELEAFLVRQATRPYDGSGSTKRRGAADTAPGMAQGE